MKRSLSVVMGFALLLLTSTEGWSLPPCSAAAATSISETIGWNNCFGHIHVEKGKFKGDSFIGEFKNGRPNGHGTHTYASGSKYAGEYKNGKKHGQGTYTYVSGNKYVGEYKNGKKHGQGAYTWVDGDKHVGEHKNGKRHGQGTFTTAKGHKYVGEWRDDQYHGHFTVTYPNGNKYLGEYKNGKKNGQGTYTYASGNKYVGEYKNNKHHGQGVYTWTNGSKYVGEFKNGKRHGQGTFTSAKGHKYVGEWRDDQYHGHFTVTYPNRNKYVGEYKKNKKHGQGIVYRADGTVFQEGIFENGKFLYAKKKSPVITEKKLPPCSAAAATSISETIGWDNCFGHVRAQKGKFKGGSYIGGFRNGRPNGHGTHTYASGSKYVGEYKNGKRNGYFIVTYANGDKYVGRYKNSKKHGHGTYTWAKGHKYIGVYKNGEEHGQGVRYRADGTVFQEGIFENGKFLYAKKKSPTVTSRKAPGPSSSKNEEEEVERLRKEVYRLKKEKKQESKPSLKLANLGSGFFISKLGHVITNAHVVKKCKSVTVGDSAKKQVAANVIETDRRNDLALLRISSMEMASADTKSLVAKLGIKFTALASEGLLRSNAVELGEDVVVAGFPFGDIFSNTIKITKGIVSAKRGMGDDSGQFQIDAAVQKGNSGGPIYDENGNIIGVVVSQLNKLKVAKAIGTLPENVNFGVKASTVRQFLDSSGLPSTWSKRSKRISTREIAQIAEKQTVMVRCYR